MFIKILQDHYNSDATFSAECLSILIKWIISKLKTLLILVFFINFGIAKADNQNAIFLDSTWRITESGMSIAPPYEIAIRIDNAGRMKAYYLGKKPLGTCPPEALNYPELAALCGNNSNAEPMSIRG